MAVVDVKTPVRDWATTVASAFVFSVVLTLELGADAEVVLDEVVAAEDSPLASSERVIVTKDMTGGGVNALEETADVV